MATLALQQCEIDKRMKGVKRVENLGSIYMHKSTRDYPKIPTFYFMDLTCDARSVDAK